MKNTSIVFTLLDDNVPVRIRTLTPKAIKLGFTAADLIDKVVPANATNVREISDADLPEDSVFRYAWDDSNPESFIGIDLPKAKLIAHDIRRVDRENKLVPLDREEGYATTTSTRKSEIVTEKNAILDANATVQTDIDNAANETALRTVLTNAGIVA